MHTVGPQAAAASAATLVSKPANGVSKRQPRDTDRFLDCLHSPRTASQTQPHAEPLTSELNCRVYSSEGFRTQLDVLLSFVGPNHRQVGATVDLSTFKKSPWTRQERVPGGKGETTEVQLGVKYEGKAEVPATAVADFLVLRLKRGVVGGREFINKIEIENKQTNGTGGWNIVVTPNTWIHESHGSRLFSARSQAYLPSETPEHLVAFREADLAAIKGTALEQGVQRSDWDRVYDYDVYNDLAGYDENGNVRNRAILGGSTEYPYPRRLRTGRSLIPGPTGELTYETRETATGEFWVPLDERFNAVKDSNFKSYGALAFIPTLAQGIRRKLLDRDGKLTDFKEVDRMYSALKDDNFNIGPVELVEAMNTPAGRPRSNAKKQLGIADLQVPRLGFLGPLQGIVLGAVSSSFKNVKSLSERGKTLLKFPEPLVQHRREGKWKDDDEFGRQALAGVNPSCIHAVTQSTDLGTITDATLAGKLGKYTLTDLRAMGETKPRLLVIDHTAVFKDYAERITKQAALAAEEAKNGKKPVTPIERFGYSGLAVIFQELRRTVQAVPTALWVVAVACWPVVLLLLPVLVLVGLLLVLRAFLLQPVAEPLGLPAIEKPENRYYGYSGRCVIFRGDDGRWRPVAIELQGWDDAAPTVYTPGTGTDTETDNVWRLAKGVFLTLDCGFHQLITHWLRCHAATEPYIIATHRCLSTLHPVYKLMVPHWRFTLNINANARSSLINADGVIEKGFTPGRYAMEMSSKVYEKLWRFDKQGLPADLIERGLAKKGADGKLELLLDDYPYADDGMLIWDAVHDWVGQYLRLYYNASDPKRSVTGDSEIMAWWDEILTKGHPDKKEGWPELETVDDLTEILTTMIWVASAHHAAINFSQYGYTGYFLNRPTICTKAIPKRGTAEYQRLVKNKEDGEKVFLETLHSTGTESAVLTVELLSTHSDNEMYLGDPDHPYILDEPALAAYKQFVDKIQAAEEEMEKRNTIKQRKVRQGLAYKFLMPSSGPGITSRGVPQSVSI